MASVSASPDHADPTVSTSRASARAAQVRAAPSRYRGRFAPSPTGSLHFGSLVAAVGSFMCARAAGGAWLVRIEDLDPPRTAPGSAEDILATLELFGLQSDGPVLRQSERAQAYAAALARLSNQGLAFPCSCSRAELQRVQANPPAAGDELFYPGWCRAGVRRPERTTAIRFRVPREPICFADLLQGPQTYDLRSSCGDFVVRRRDGLFAYQLAVVVDDAEQGVTHVVRGADLLSSTPRQIALQNALDLPTPVYAHLPVAIDANGIKLSKSQGAAAVNSKAPVQELWRALEFLRQSPPDELRRAALADVWDWAHQHWCVQPLKGLREVVVDGHAQ